MDDLERVVLLVAALGGGGVGLYAVFAVVQALVKRLEGRKPGPGLDDIEAIHARLAASEALEARVEELEQRLDFAERMIARHDPDRLPMGRSPDHR